MQDADTQVEETIEPSTAEEPQEQELTVPKHRLDEVSGENRRLKEELEMKNRAITDFISARQPQQQPVVEDDEAEFESLGLSREVAKKVKSMQGKQIAQAKQEFGGVIGTMANRLEETNFLLDYGKEKRDYIPKIRDLRKAHAARGSFLDVETAYRLIRVDELERKASAPAKKPAESKESKEAKPKVEDKVTTEAKPKAPATSAGKSIEDWENELDESFKATGLKSF